MSPVSKSVFLASFVGLSVTAGTVNFDNQSNRDITFFVGFKKIHDSKEISVGAKKNKNESLDVFLKQAPVDTKTRIYARPRKKVPYHDLYCSPVVTAGDLGDPNADWQITYTGKSCKVVRK